MSQQSRKGPSFMDTVMTARRKFKTEQYNAEINPDKEIVVQLFKKDDKNIQKTSSGELGGIRSQTRVASKKEDLLPVLNETTESVEENGLALNTQLTGFSSIGTPRQKLDSLQSEYDESENGTKIKRISQKRINSNNLLTTNFVENLMHKKKENQLEDDSGSVRKKKKKNLWKVALDKDGEAKQKAENEKNFKSFLVTTQVMKDEIFFQKKNRTCLKALRSSLFFGKHLHLTTMEYMAKSSILVESRHYVENILQGTGALPNITLEKIGLRPSVEHEALRQQFMAERLKEQDLTRTVNFLGDLLIVVSGNVKIYLTDMQKNDDNVFVIDLKAGDYIDPYCNLSNFKNKRVTSINQQVRKMNIIKMTIQHSFWQEDHTSFIRVPQKIYYQYIRDKNYLSIYSKEDIDQFLLKSFPEAPSLESEKYKNIMRQILTFDLLPPNTMLMKEGQTEANILYAVVQGQIRVFKKDYQEPQQQKNKKPSKQIDAQKTLRVQDQIIQGKLGRQITNLLFDDLGDNARHLVPQSKTFIGLDITQDQKAKYSMVTSPSQWTPVFKCLPEHLFDFLKHERKCLRALNERMKKMYQDFQQQNFVKTKGEHYKVLVEDPDAVPEIDYSNNDRQFEYGTKALNKNAQVRDQKQNLQIALPLVEDEIGATAFEKLSQDHIDSQQELQIVQTKEIDNRVKKLPKLGCLKDEDIIHLKQRREQFFQDLGPPAKTDQIFYLGDLGGPDATKHLNYRQRTIYHQIREDNEMEIASQVNEFKNMKKNLRKGSTIKKVPLDIDIYNKFEKKFDLRRKYATPINQRVGLIQNFEETFYNKTRKNEIKRDATGKEVVQSSENKTEMYFENLRKHSTNQSQNHQVKSLGYHKLEIQVKKNDEELARNNLDYQNFCVEKPRQSSFNTTLEKVSNNLNRNREAMANLIQKKDFRQPTFTPLSTNIASPSPQHSTSGTTQFNRTHFGKTFGHFSISEKTSELTSRQNQTPIPQKEESQGFLTMSRPITTNDPSKQGDFSVANINRANHSQASRQDDSETTRVQGGLNTTNLDKRSVQDQTFDYNSSLPTPLQNPNGQKDYSYLANTEEREKRIRQLESLNVAQFNMISNRTSEYFFNLAKLDQEEVKRMQNQLNVTQGSVSNANQIVIEEAFPEVAKITSQKQTKFNSRNESLPRRYSPRTLAPIRTLVPQFSMKSPKFHANGNQAKPKQPQKLMRGRVLRSPHAPIDQQKQPMTMRSPRIDSVPSYFSTHRQPFKMETKDQSTTLTPTNAKKHKIQLEETSGYQQISLQETTELTADGESHQEQQTMLSSAIAALGKNSAGTSKEISEERIFPSKTRVPPTLSDIVQQEFASGKINNVIETLAVTRSPGNSSMDVNENIQNDIQMFNMLQHLNVKNSDPNIMDVSFAHTMDNSSPSLDRVLSKGEMLLQFKKGEQNIKKLKKMQEQQKLNQGVIKEKAESGYEMLSAEDLKFKQYANVSMVVLNKKMPGWNKQVFGGGMNSNKKAIQQKYQAHILNQTSSPNSNLTSTFSNKMSWQENLFTKANIKKGLEKKFSTTLNEQSNPSIENMENPTTSEINAWNTPQHLRKAPLSSISVTPASKMQVAYQVPVAKEEQPLDVISGREDSDKSPNHTIVQEESKDNIIVVVQQNQILQQPQPSQVPIPIATNFISPQKNSHQSPGRLVGKKTLAKRASKQVSPGQSSRLSTNSGPSRHDQKEQLDLTIQVQKQHLSPNVQLARAQEQKKMIMEKLHKMGEGVTITQRSFSNNPTMKMDAEKQNQTSVSRDSKQNSKNSQEQFMDQNQMINIKGSSESLNIPQRETPVEKIRFNIGDVDRLDQVIDKEIAEMHRTPAFSVNRQKVYINDPTNAERTLVKDLNANPIKLPQAHDYRDTTPPGQKIQKGGNIFVSDHMQNFNQSPVAKNIILKQQLHSTQMTGILKN